MLVAAHSRLKVLNDGYVRNKSLFDDDDVTLLIPLGEIQVDTAVEK